MRQKPHELGLCHRDGCGEPAKWSATLILRNTPIKAETTVHVCDKHKLDATAYILNDENRDRLVRELVDQNWCTKFIAEGTVKHNATVTFNPIG